MVPRFVGLMVACPGSVLFTASIHTNLVNTSILNDTSLAVSTSLTYFEYHPYLIEANEVS